jgi:hypothetical protein
MLHPLATAIPLAFNSQGLADFLISKILPLILVFIGIGIVAVSRKGNMSQVMTTLIIAVVGLVFIGGAGALVAFGDEIAGIAFGG